MICCKITTDFDIEQGNFSGLLEKLGKLGEIYWESGKLFFADVENDKTDKNTIARVLRKNGYQDFFIQIYTNPDQLKEGDYIDGWIAGKLIKIQYENFERTNQEVLKNIKTGLDMLNTEIDQIREKALAEEKSDTNKNLKEGEHA